MSLPSSPPQREEEAHAASVRASPSPPPSVPRLWRPAAQRNMRNQWSRLRSCRKKWAADSLCGRASAIALVNAYLSRSYMPGMNLGVLNDMSVIRENACKKLTRKQEQSKRNLLSIYGDLVDVLCQLKKARDSMRCYLKGNTSSPLVQFSQLSQENDDPGDGGGVPVFTSWALPQFEILAQELIDMFSSELILKRLIVLQLVSIGCGEDQQAQIEGNWSEEIYEGEFDDLAMVKLLCIEGFQPITPRIRDFKSNESSFKLSKCSHTRENLQVYLTTWISDINIDTVRVDEIFGMVEEEMRVKLS